MSGNNFQESKKNGARIRSNSIGSSTDNPKKIQSTFSSVESTFLALNPLSPALKQSSVESIFPGVNPLQALNPLFPAFTFSDVASITSGESIFSGVASIFRRLIHFFQR